MLVGRPQHFRWLRGIVAAILVLNAIDAALTIVWVSSGEAREANPIMRGYFAHGAVPFAAVKLVLVSLGTFLLWRHRRRPLAVVGIFVALLTYYYVLLYHLSAMNLDLLGLG